MIPEKHKALAHAWVEGAEIEVYHPVTGEWVFIPSPGWGETNEYRIRVKPITKWRWLLLRKIFPEGETAEGVMTQGDTSNLFVVTSAWYTEDEVYDLWPKGSPMFEVLQRIDATEKVFNVT